MTAMETRADAASGAARGEAPGPAEPETRATSSAGLSLASHLGRLQDLDGSALRGEWRRLSRSEPPRVSRDLLARALAYRLQEIEFGGLPKWARQTFAGAVAAADRAEASGAPVPAPRPAAPRLKPGVRLVREWHGRTHSVVVLDDAFEFEGRRYRSLTQIAREITGAHWSGPRFFGLMKRKPEAESDGAPPRHAEPEKAGGLAPPGLGASSIEARPDVARAEHEGVRRFGQRAEACVHG